MYPVWRTTYSFKGFRTAFLLIVVSLPIYILWILLGALSGTRPASTVAFFIALALTLFVAYRTAGERVETHPEGIVIGNLFKTHHIRWEEVQDIHVACRDIVKTLPSGAVAPPIEEWVSMVERNPQYMLFDMWNGPQEIRALWISLNNGEMLFVGAADRNILESLLESYKYVREMSGSDYLD